eukprot:3146727-Alexandrium_andersonii.AAC.1
MRLRCFWYCGHRLGYDGRPAHPRAAAGRRQRSMRRPRGPLRLMGRRLPSASSWSGRPLRRRSAARPCHAGTA